MTPAVVAIILAATFVTATISGVFGMAGGLIMKGVLVSFVAVSISMVMHGFIQIVSNLSRAALLFRNIGWRLVGRYGLGALGAVVVLLAVNWRPGQTAVFFMLGLTAMLVQIPKRWVELNVERRWQAEICGFGVQMVNTLAGVAGPLLDIFFVKTALPRQQVVATKAATQVLAHGVKIAFWGAPLLAGWGSDAEGMPPLWLFAAVIPVSIFGTWLGGKVLDRMTDVSFRSWTKWIVTATGSLYLLQGCAALLAKG